MVTSHKLKKQAIPDLPSDLSNKAGISLNNLDSTGESHFQTPIDDLDTIRSGATAGSTAVQPSSLASVATSGSYSDLSNKPTIPTVNNATLTIQKNGTTVKTFTANASSNITCNITVPTAAADISAEPAISLTASRALVSNSGGKVAVSSITSTELGYVSGVTSAIQTQLDAKAPTNSPVFTGTPTAPTAAADTNTTQIATTAFVQSALSSGGKTVPNWAGKYSILADTTYIPSGKSGTSPGNGWIYFYIYNTGYQFVAKVAGVTVAQTESYSAAGVGSSAWIGERRAVVPVATGDSVYVYNGTAVFVPCK